MTTILGLGVFVGVLGVVVSAVPMIFSKEGSAKRRTWTARLLGSFALAIGCLAPFVLEPLLGLPMVFTTSALVTLALLVVGGAIVKRRRAAPLA